MSEATQETRRSGEEVDEILPLVILAMKEGWSRPESVAAETGVELALVKRAFRRMKRRNQIEQVISRHWQLQEWFLLTVMP